MENAPAVMAQAIRGAMDIQNQATVTHILATRMSGKGPYPAEQHRLGRVTSRYAQSLQAFPAQIEGDQVISSIGSNVKYAAIHEFGAEFQRTVKPGTVRLRTDRAGNIALRGGRLATFAKSTHKQAKEVAYAGGSSHLVKIPARAPVTTGIEDRLPEYGRAFSRAIITAFNHGGAA